MIIQTPNMRQLFIPGGLQVMSAGGGAKVVSPYALSFDGSNDYVSISDEPGLLDSDPNTVSMWIKCDAVNSYPVIFCRGTTNNDYFLELNASAGFYWGCGGSYRTYTGMSLSANTWYHIALVKSGAATGELYLNGVLQTSFSGSLSATGDSSAPLWIGAYGNAPTPSQWFFPGKIDDVRIYNTALTAQQISDLYAAENVTDGLIAHWKLDEGTGTTASDSVGSAHGTLTNGPTWTNDVPTPLA